MQSDIYWSYGYAILLLDKKSGTDIASKERNKGHYQLHIKL